MKKRYKLIILGAGKEQQSLYGLCRSKSLIPIGVDKKIENLRKVKCKERINTSVHNFKEIINKIKKKKHIIGAISFGLDAPRTILKINNWLNKSYYPEQSVEISKNKYKLYKNLSNKFNIPHFKKVKNLKEVLKFTQKYKFPIILKPFDKSGSRDVLFFKNKRELFKALNSNNSYFREKKLIQKFVSWQQISAEALIFDDKCNLIISDRNYNDTKKFHPHIIENGGTVPSKTSATLKKKIEEFTLKIAKELKIKFGPLKLDLAINNKKIFLIEAAMRFGGGRVGHDISKKIYNCSLVEKYIDFLKNGSVKSDKFKHNGNYCINRFFIANKKIKMKLIKLDVIKKYKKNILLYYLTKKNKELLNKPKWHGDRCGMVSVYHKRFSKCYMIANEIVKNISSQINYGKELR